jgi:hypothetical protein
MSRPPSLFFYSPRNQFSATARHRNHPKTAKVVVIILSTGAAGINQVQNSIASPPTLNIVTGSIFNDLSAIAIPAKNICYVTQIKERPRLRSLVLILTIVISPPDWFQILSIADTSGKALACRNHETPVRPAD